MFGRTNFTGNALLGQIVAESRKPALKWTRDANKMPSRAFYHAKFNNAVSPLSGARTGSSIFAAGFRHEYLVTAIIDSWCGDKIVGWSLTIDPGTYSERTRDFDKQAEAKEAAAIHEAR